MFSEKLARRSEHLPLKYIYVRYYPHLLQFDIFFTITTSYWSTLNVHVSRFVAIHSFRYRR